MTQNTDIQTKTGKGEVAVWDILTRLFHWSLVISFTIAYLTEDLETLHSVIGHIVGGLILWRIVWGFIGPKTSRFSDFITSPFVAVRYAFALLAGRSERHIGHSPAGGAMIIALLVVILGAVVTGIMLEQIGEIDWIEDLHEVLANISVALIFFHVGGVVLASFAHGENLVRAMITGRKRAP